MKNYLVMAAMTIMVFCSAAQTACSQIQNQKPVSLAETNSETKPEPTPLLLSPLRADGFVTDHAGIVDVDSERQFEDALSKLQKQAKIDLVLLVMRTTHGEKISDYSLSVARDWKIGSANGGALMVVAIDDRTWHIQIDKKLEKYLTNEEVKTYGNLMAPYFKEKKYVEGLKTGLEKMIAHLAEKQKFDPIKI